MTAATRGNEAKIGEVHMRGHCEKACVFTLLLALTGGAGKDLVHPDGEAFKLARRGTPKSSHRDLLI
jgi:hypothetical protein